MEGWIDAKYFCSLYMKPIDREIRTDSQSIVCNATQDSKIKRSKYTTYLVQQQINSLSASKKWYTDKIHEVQECAAILSSVKRLLPWRRSDVIETRFVIAVFSIGWLFLIGQTRSDAIWPFFFAGRRQKDRPDRVRPGLTNEKAQPLWLVHTADTDKTRLINYRCSRCELNWRQVKTVCVWKFRNSFVQSRNVVRLSRVLSWPSFQFARNVVTYCDRCDVIYGNWAKTSSQMRSHRRQDCTKLFCLQ